MSDTTWVTGLHAVKQSLLREPKDCIKLYYAENSNRRIDEVVAVARQAEVSLQIVSRAELDALSSNQRHQGCVLESRISKVKMSFDECMLGVGPDSLILVLEEVQDPHNLGACLRSADAAGVDAVIIPTQRAAKMTSTVSKVASGAAETVALIEVTNINRSLQDLQQAGVWIYGTCGDAEESLYDHSFQGPVALVMGGEASGLRRLTRKGCDHLIKIPMLGQVESLNVSVATGICLFEIRRARSTCGQA